jgi:hypothetical protein
MRRLIMRCCAGLFAVLIAAASIWSAEPAPAPRPIGQPATAIVESSLSTGAGRIRQFAFDGDPDTYFASAKNAGKNDDFTLIFDTPISVKAVRVLTGLPKGRDALDSGVLEVSSDGTAFEALGKFAKGSAAGTPRARVKAIRIRPTVDLDHPLIIREIVLDPPQPPGAALFRYPIEIVVDVSDAPEMKAWAEKAARVCERQYPMICAELMSDGFKPLTVIQMALKKDYEGVAQAGGWRITGSVKYFQGHPKDIGAMVHETVHCVQLYRARTNPGWLVEGVADYIRFFKYEPTKPRPLPPEQAVYDSSYRVTAAFLAFVAERYDPQIVRKLNAAMRAGTYKPNTWMMLTGHSVEALGREWQKSLAR